MPSPPVKRVRVEGKNWRFDLNTPRIDLIQEEYHHEVAVVYAYVTPAVRKRLVKWQPTTMTYGFATNTTGWPGYINHVESWAGAKPHRGFQAVKIIGVGASARLKGTGPKVWRNANLIRIVREVARANYLYASTSGPGREFGTVTQGPGESTWAFLSRLAKASGYTLIATGTTIRCYPRTQIPERLYPANILSHYLHEARFTEASGTSGKQPPSPMVAATLDPKTLARVRSVQTVKEASPITKFVATAAARAADARVELAAREMMRAFPYRAVVKVRGMRKGAAVRAVRPVFINPRHMSEQTGRTDISREAGLWHCLAARHIITGTRYEIVLDLGRQEDTFIPLPPPAPTPLPTEPPTDIIWQPVTPEPIIPPDRCPAQPQPALLAEWRSVGAGPRGFEHL